MSEGQDLGSIQAHYNLNDIFTILTNGLAESVAKAEEHKNSELLSSVHGCAVATQQGALEILAAWKANSVEFVAVPVEVSRSALPATICPTSLGHQIKDGIIKPVGMA